MKMLTKNTDYAIRALLVFSLSKDEFLSAKEISEKQNIPYPFLRKILNELIKNEIIYSKEGKTGGFKIKKNPKNIKVLDLIKIFQGNFEISDCLFRKKICPNRTTCVLRHEIQRINEIINNEFEKLSIKYLSNKLENPNA